MGTSPTRSKIAISDFFNAMDERSTSAYGTDLTRPIASVSSYALEAAEIGNELSTGQGNDQMQGAWETASPTKRHEIYSRDDSTTQLPPVYKSESQISLITESIDLTSPTTSISHAGNRIDNARSSATEIAELSASPTATIFRATYRNDNARSSITENLSASPTIDSCSETDAEIADLISLFTPRFRRRNTASVPITGGIKRA
ncbi:MAG: hypothetical protein M4579_006340 [Chaenotheca gracillima]|nr:MAG: hypothetical protein M4579_006340 [Chaenotheca gracillima]